MTEELNGPSINNHLQVISEVDSKSQEIVDTLEQFKLSLQKMIDINSIEEEGIKLMELVYEQINLLRKKQEDFKLDIESMLSEVGFSLGKLDLNEEDIEKIKWNSFQSSKNGLNAIVSKIEYIFKKLIKLKSCSFDSDEYTNLKKELYVMIFGDNNLVIGFYNNAKPKSRQLLLNEYKSDLKESKLKVKKNSKGLKQILNVGQNNDKSSLLNGVIDMIEATFKLENSDLIKSYYDNIYELRMYLGNLNLIREKDNIEIPNYSDKIKSLIDEIATMIKQELPEIDSLITQKIEGKI